jgi:hypothetical protein
MGEHYTAPEFTGLSCDKANCTTRKTTDPLPTWSSRREEFEAQAASEGWTIWAGRTRRVYCPAHKPQDGHRMRLVSKLPALACSCDATGAPENPHRDYCELNHPHHPCDPRTCTRHTVTPAGV